MLALARAGARGERIDQEGAGTLAPLPSHPDVGSGTLSVMARVFLSHASVDKPTVRRIAEALCAAGHEPWLADEQILVGDSIPTAVERGLRQADFVVVCLSRAAAEQGWTEAERAATMMQQFRDRRELILPVRLEDVAPPPLLEHIAYVDLFPGEESFRHGTERLVRSIAGHELRINGMGHRSPRKKPYALMRPMPDPLTPAESRSPDAVALVRSMRIGSPIREISVTPFVSSGNGISPVEISRVAVESQIWTVRGQPMFPMLDLCTRSERRNEGLLWSIDGARYSPRFALGLDGSYAYREVADETLRGHRIWGSGLGIFHCADRIVGAVLYARRLASRLSGFGRAQVTVVLDGVQGQCLAFDFEGERVRGIHMSGRRYACNEPTARVGGSFDPTMQDTDVEAFCSDLCASITYFFGWDWQAEFAAEIHAILLNASNRGP